RMLIPSASTLFFLSLFLLILRPPPRSTLFPYTTLFRSPDGAARRQVVVNIGAVHRERIGTGYANHNRGVRWPVSRMPRDQAAKRDRKSTRLNSSHDQISYAVFCLKKKKKKQRYTIENHL